MLEVRSGLMTAALAAAALAGGCGSSSGPATVRTNAQSSSTPAGPPTGAGVVPAPRPTRLPVKPADLRVIREWSSALRHGDVGGAAGYFALPSKMVIGPGANGTVPVLVLRTRAQAAAANATLPCGAVFVSADQRGRFVNALFRLTDRPGPGGGCGSGTGQSARTNFVIVGDRIVEWFRAPDDPGDNQGGQTPGGQGGQTPGGQAPAPPSPTQSTGSSI